jgi:hypothetical protein
MRTRTPLAALAVLTTTLLSTTAAPAQAQTPAARLIAPRRLALPVTAFGPGARITGVHIDRTVSAIDRDATLDTTTDHAHQGPRYTRFGGSGTLYEAIRLPATARTGSTPRWVYVMATAFPTTGAAQAVYKRDTAALASIYDFCGRPALGGVRGRYSTRSCQIHRSGSLSTYVVVTGVQGNVVLAFYTSVGNDRAGSLVQAKADASTVARKAFAAYAHLPVHRGPAPAAALLINDVPATATPQPTSTPLPVPTSTPTLVPTSTPVPTQTVASVPVSTTYQATIPGASVVWVSSTNSMDGSTFYLYSVTWTDTTFVGSTYMLNVNNPTTSDATTASAGALSAAQASYIGGTQQTSTNGSYWVVQEVGVVQGASACRVTTGTAIGTTALAVESVAVGSDCGTATTRNASIVASLSTIVTA